MKLGEKEGQNIIRANIFVANYSKNVNYGVETTMISEAFTRLTL